MSGYWVAKKQHKDNWTAPPKLKNPPESELVDSSLNHVTEKRNEVRPVGKDWKMLVLSRKKNESIVINNDIKIVVVEIRGDKVRLGVEAPREVPVHRREVYDAIQRSLESGDAPVES